MSAPADPSGVTCPHCHADPGDPCLKPDGEDAPAPHARRVKEAQREAAAAARRAQSDVPATVDAAGADWRRVYVACRSELELKGQWTKLGAKQLTAMVLNMAQADACRVATDAEPMVDGSQGQKVPNGLWATQTRLDSQALAIARALKLTPDTRGTSATGGADGDEDDRPPADTGEAEDRDALAQLDELAERRKKPGARRRAAG